GRATRRSRARPGSACHIDWRSRASTRAPAGADRSVIPAISVMAGNPGPSEGGAADPSSAPNLGVGSPRPPAKQLRSGFHERVDPVADLLREGDHRGRPRDALDLEDPGDDPVEVFV